MTIKDLHNKAMTLADDADQLKRAGETDKALSLYTNAFNFESEAAYKSYKENIGEPTTSILLRSAASLAISCNKNREAEKLIALGLSGEPPLEIANELRDLLESVNFSRHLELKGIQLYENEVQLVVAGNGVGFGLAKTEDVTDRVDTFKNIAIRTIERKKGRKFRGKGAIPDDVKFESYISSNRAASLAFTFRFGNLGENTLDGFGSYENIIDDITENISLVNENKIDELKKRIEDDDYFHNFISLTKELAPDGDSINLFGITSIKNGKIRKTELVSQKKEILGILKDINTFGKKTTSLNTSNQPINESIVGYLKIANATNNVVEVEIEDKSKIKINVPEGLSDIVKKYWEKKVSVDYFLKGKSKKILVSIDEI